MSGLDAAIRVELAAWRLNVENLREHGAHLIALDVLMRAQDAIGAVLDLHPTIEDGVNPPHCAHCGVREIEPCPTKRAIAEKLGVEVER